MGNCALDSWLCRMCQAVVSLPLSDFLLASSSSAKWRGESSVSVHCVFKGKKKKKPKTLSHYMSSADARLEGPQAVLTVLEAGLHLGDWRWGQCVPVCTDDRLWFSSICVDHAQHPKYGMCHLFRTVLAAVGIAKRRPFSIILPSVLLSGENLYIKLWKCPRQGQPAARVPGRHKRDLASVVCRGPGAPLDSLRL